MDRKVKLLKERSVLVTYLLIKVEAEDFHAVSDAANDIREIDAELKGIDHVKRNVIIHKEE